MSHPSDGWKNGLCDGFCGAHTAGEWFASWLAAPFMYGRVDTRNKRFPEESKLPVFNVPCLVQFLAFVESWFCCPIMLYALPTMYTRTSIRERFNIGGERTQDCCIACWCMCCTLAQMDHEMKERAAMAKGDVPSVPYVMPANGMVYVPQTPGQQVPVMAVPVQMQTIQEGQVQTVPVQVPAPARVVEPSYEAQPVPPPLAAPASADGYIVQPPPQAYIEERAQPSSPIPTVEAERVPEPSEKVQGAGQVALPEYSAIDLEPVQGSAPPVPIDEKAELPAPLSADIPTPPLDDVPVQPVPETPPAVEVKKPEEIGVAI